MNPEPPASESSSSSRSPQQRGHAPLTFVFAAIPVLALTAGIPFANRLEPRICGLPFLLAWIVGWLLLTPVCMALAAWRDRQRRNDE